MHFMDILFILEKDSLCYSFKKLDIWRRRHILPSVYVPLQTNTYFHILDKTDALSQEDKHITGDVVTNLGELSVHFVTPPRADLPTLVHLGTNFLEGGAVKSRR